MNIQSSLNQTFSVATFLLSQTDIPKTAKLNQRLKTAQKATEQTAKPILGTADDEASFTAYENALKTEAEAAEAVFQADPTEKSYKTMKETRGYYDDQVEAREHDMEQRMKAEQDRLNRDAIRRKILSGGLE